MVQGNAEKFVSVCVRFSMQKEWDRTKLLSGHQNENFTDFEDCLQMECAMAYNAEYFVARNIADYKTSEVWAIWPREYLEL